MEINLIYEHLTHIVAPAMAEPDTGAGICDRCGQMVDSGYTSKGAYNIYKHKNLLFHCRACHSLDVGDPDITGIERAAGKSGKFVPNKFGMMASTGALIEVDSGKTTFFAPQKIIDKLPKSFTKKINVRTELGMAQLQIVSNAKPPFLYISDFGRKTDLLVANLKTTLRLENVYACSDNGVNEFNLLAAKNIHKTLEKVDRKDFSLFTETVSKLCRGLIDPMQTGEVLGDNKNLVSAFKMLPADPHIRLATLPLLRRMRDQ